MEKEYGGVGQRRRRKRTEPHITGDDGVLARFVCVIQNGSSQEVDMDVIRQVATGAQHNSQKFFLVKVMRGCKSFWRWKGKMRFLRKEERGPKGSMSLGTMAPVSSASVTPCGSRRQREAMKMATTKRTVSSGGSFGAAFVSELVSVPDVRVWVLVSLSASVNALMNQLSNFTPFASL